MIALGIGVLLSCDDIPRDPGQNCAGCGVCECDDKTGFVDNPGDTSPCVCSDDLVLYGDYCFNDSAFGESASATQTYEPTTNSPTSLSASASEGTTDTLGLESASTLDTEDASDTANTSGSTGTSGDQTSGTDGATSDTDSTSTTGTTGGGTCGDLVVDEGEMCDEGPAPSPTCSPTCSACEGLPVVDQALVDCAGECATEDVIYQDQQSLAQVFRAGQTGWVERVRVRMANEAAATTQVELLLVALADDPLALEGPGFDLAGNTLALESAAITIALDWQELELGAAPMIETGQYYAIVTRLVGAQDPGALVARWEHMSGLNLQIDPYPLGDAYTCAGDCSAWLPANGALDRLFEVQVTPLCE
jgi:hypothetical protein